MISLLSMPRFFSVQECLGGERCISCHGETALGGAYIYIYTAELTPRQGMG